MIRRGRGREGERKGPRKIAVRWYKVEEEEGRKAGPGRRNGCGKGDRYDRKVVGGRNCRKMRYKRDINKVIKKQRRENGKTEVGRMR